MEFFSREDGKSLIQIKPLLSSEYRIRARARAVAFEATLVQNQAKEAVILFHETNQADLTTEVTESTEINLWPHIVVKPNFIEAFVLILPFGLTIPFFGFNQSLEERNRAKGR